MLFLAFVLINVLVLASIDTALHRAPVGYEDELGFYFAVEALGG